MDFCNENFCDYLRVDDKLDQEGEVEFTILDGIGSTSTTYLDIEMVKELIKHLQKVLEESEK